MLIENLNGARPTLVSRMFTRLRRRKTLVVLSAGLS